MDFEDRRRGPARGSGATAQHIEDAVLRIRRELFEHSALGEYGAAAIHRAMVASGDVVVPSVRTIARIVARRGAVVRRRRVRNPPPPRGWYLPDVARGEADVDGFDVIAHFATTKDKHVEVLTGISVRGHHPMAVVCERVSARSAIDALILRWRTSGLPRYAQFDNDTRFTGITTSSDVFGRVIRACLQLGVTPVFAAPREHGFQNFVEAFNGRWKAVVRGRFRPESMEATRAHSNRFVAALREKNGPGATRLRRLFPRKWELNLQAPLRGRVVFVRRCDEDGRVRVLGHTILVGLHRAHGLVRCDVELTRRRIRFFALDRSIPTSARAVLSVPYRPPRRAHFWE